MSQDWRRRSDRLSFELAPYTYHFVLINFVCLKIIQTFQQTGTLLGNASIKIERLKGFMVLQKIPLAIEYFHHNLLNVTDS